MLGVRPVSADDGSFLLEKCLERTTSLSYINFDFGNVFQNIYILFRQLVRRVRQVAPLLGPAGSRGCRAIPSVNPTNL